MATARGRKGPAGRVLECIWIALAALLPVGLTSMADGHEMAALLKIDVVQLEVMSGGSPRYARGFIVGEARNDLLVVTARHAVLCDAPGCTTTINVRFLGYTRSFEGVLVGSIAIIDLALVAVEKPESYEWKAACVDTSEPRQETAVWPFGMDQTWDIPLRSTPSYIRSTDVTRTWIDIARADIRPGASGAPVVSDRGIVGMIVTDSGSDARALWIEVIRRAVVERGLVWGLSGTCPSAVVGGLQDGSFENGSPWISEFPSEAFRVQSSVQHGGIGATDGSWACFIRADTWHGLTPRCMYQESVDFGSATTLVFDWTACDEHVAGGATARIRFDGVVIWEHDIWEGGGAYDYLRHPDETVDLAGLSGIGRLTLELDTTSDWAEIIFDNLRLLGSSG